MGFPVSSPSSRISNPIAIWLSRSRILSTPFNLLRQTHRMADSEFVVVAEPVISDRIVTAYAYTNLEVSNPTFATGFLYHDNSTDLVQWQCGNVVTSWHGFCAFGHDDTIHVAFDCLAGQRDNDAVRLKTSLFYKVGHTIGGHTYEGFDYKGRAIQLTPKTRWAYINASGVWKRIADWTTSTHEWIQIE